MESISTQLLGRARWLIRLRWLVCLVVLIVVLLSVFVFRVPLPLKPLLALNLTLVLYNILLTIVLHRIHANLPKQAMMILRWQLSMDYILLACFLHYSGGIENPFSFYLIFHVVFSSIIFDRTKAFIQTTFGVLLFAGVVLLEYFEVVPHYSVFTHGSKPLFENPIYLLAVSCALISALYFATFLATNIALELRKREIELQNMNASLTDQDRRKSEYVMMILHDLKEPIATVHNCMQLVLGGFCGEVDNKAKQTLSRGSNWLQKMILLTHDLLSLSRMKIMPIISLKPVLLNKEIDKILTEHKAAFLGKSLLTHFTLPNEPVWIKGDAEIFTHIFTNLISNAIKYTPPQGTIGIHLEVDDNCVKLEVWDTGIGIPPEYQEKVFEDFYRTPQAIEFDQQGTGLGLAIVKHGVEIFNGSITVTSPHDKTPGQQGGTCFCLEFQKVRQE